MLAQSLAHYVLSLDYISIPEMVIQRVKRSILDTLGVVIAGASTSIGNSITRYVSSLGGSQESTVIARHVKCPAPLAALANGTMAHALDYDDSSISLSGHPSASVLPAALAVGEAKHVSGKELLTALVAGYEIACKIGKASNPEHFDRGFHPTSTLGVFGAAIASGRILGLSVSQLAQALGIAASLSSGLQGNFGTLTKPLHAGWAAQNGIVACLLAEAGLTSSESILEGSRGFFEAYVGKRIDPFQIRDRLGNPFELMDPGFTYKLFPTCSRTQAAISGILDLLEDHQISREMIDSVKCGTDDRAHEILIFHTPKTMDEGRFSMEFCLALAIVQRNVRMGDFSEQRLRDPQILELMRRIKMFVDPEILSLGYDKRSAVSIRLKLIDGGEYKTISYPKGFVENPITDQDLISKYEDCAGVILTRESVKRSLEGVLKLEELDRVNDLIQTLVPKTSI